MAKKLSSDIKQFKYYQTLFNSDKPEYSLSIAVILYSFHGCYNWLIYATIRTFTVFQCTFSNQPYVAH